jgi:GNAT superfamily N-acetyltransferase
MSKDAIMSRYIIRLAHPADIPRIREMQERSMLILGGAFYTSNELSNFLTLFGTMDDTLVEEGHYFVAEDHRSAILGSGGWTRSRPGYANAIAATEPSANMPTVRSVFVDPAATRLGIASAIMLRMERDALEHGVDTLHLTATLSGLALYEALGYRTEEATELKFPDESRFKCIKMRKLLAKAQSRTAA